jgi:hypothetical protein
MNSEPWIDYHLTATQAGILYTDRRAEKDSAEKLPKGGKSRLPAKTVAKWIKNFLLSQWHFCATICPTCGCALCCFPLKSNGQE